MTHSIAQMSWHLCELILVPTNYDHLNKITFGHLIQETVRLVKWINVFKSFLCTLEFHFSVWRQALDNPPTQSVVKLISFDYYLKAVKKYTAVMKLDVLHSGIMRWFNKRSSLVIRWLQDWWDIIHLRMKSCFFGIRPKMCHPDSVITISDPPLPSSVGCYMPQVAGQKTLKFFQHLATCLWWIHIYLKNQNRSDFSAAI